jgi:branched-chain amino acid transport system substrate-binding protein
MQSRRKTMKTGFARTALGAALLLGAATNFAHAQDKAVKIGVLTDMSGLYSDITGAGSVAAAKMAVEDSGLTKKG